MVTFGDTSVVSIELEQPDGLLERKWLEVGERIGNWTLEEIEREENLSVRLLSEDGKVLVLHAQGATITPTQPEGFDPEWINSDANPMLNRAPNLTEDLRNTWTELSDDEQEQIIQMYRNHGWVVSFEPPATPYDPFRSHFSPIFPEKLQQRLAVIRDTFLNSLTPEQLAGYRAYQNTRPPSAESPAPEAQRLSLVRPAPQDEEYYAQLRNQYNNWLRSLSDDQMRLYYRMTRDPNP